MSKAATKVSVVVVFFLRTTFRHRVVFPRKREREREREREKKTCCYIVKEEEERRDWI